MFANMKSVLSEENFGNLKIVLRCARVTIHADWAIEESKKKKEEKYSLELENNNPNIPPNQRNIKTSLGMTLYYTFQMLSQQFKVYTIFISADHINQLANDFARDFGYNQCTEVLMADGKEKIRDFAGRYQPISNGYPSIQRFLVPRVIKEINPQIELEIVHNVSEPYSFFVRPHSTERTVYYDRISNF